MAPRQRIAQLTGLAARYARFGATSEARPRSVGELFILLVSTPGKGKTTFLESCPYLLRFDLDRAGSSHPAPKAVSLPHPSDATWSWRRMCEVVAALEDDARNMRPDRPVVVAFDTLDSMIDLAVRDLGPDIVKAIQPDVGSGTEVAGAFSLLDARRSWPLIYDKIVPILFRLRMAGYGLVLTSHLVETRLLLDNETTQKFDLSMSDGLWRRINGKLDLVMALSDVMVREKLKDKQGRTILGPPTLTKRLFLASDTDTPREFGTYLKRRGPLPIPTSIAIAGFDGWQQFAEIMESPVPQDRPRNNEPRPKNGAQSTTGSTAQTSSSARTHVNGIHKEPPTREREKA